MTLEELNRARDIKDDIRNLEWRITALKKTAENIVPVMDGLPHSTTIKSRVEKIALSIAEKEKALADLREKFADIAFDINSQINSSELTAKEKAVLSLRYAACMTFQDIWLSLETSDAQIFYLHRSALKKIFKN